MNINEVKLLELKLKASAVSELIADLFEDKDVLKVEVYDEIERIISGRVSEESVKAKLSKAYLRDFNKATEGKDDAYGEVLLKTTLISILKELIE